jgi:phosphoglucomutase
MTFIESPPPSPQALSDQPLDSICQALGARYGELGTQAATRLRHWLSGAVPYAHPEILQRHLSPAHVDLLFDSFWQELPFGTGGRRGRVGYGPNRVNPTTIAMAVQGHCHYLRGAFPDRKELEIVIANDVRVFSDVAGTYRFLGTQHPLLGVSSRSLARLACEIYAANGIVAYLAEPHADTAYLSTPELSFLVGALGAVGGIVLSASHNPPDDNGIKLYDQYGGQPVAPDDQHLLDAMSRSLHVQAMPFAQALQEGWVRPIPPDRHDRYVRLYVDLYGSFGVPRPDLPIVYTPLCGCGLTSVGDVWKALNFPIQSPPAEGPDGTFAVIPFRSPNPEVPQSTEPARAFADQVGSEIVLSSDPDADRVGLEVKLADGSWYHFDGNQIASVLCYALMLDPDGPRRTGLVVETLVTTKLLRRIAELRGDSPVIDDLLVGFKYVADVLKTLEATGRYRDVHARPEQLILAAEESHGVCLLPQILDKDSTPACIFLAGLYQRQKVQGKTLLDYYLAIIERVGGYDSVNRSLMMSGPEGVQRRDRIMSWLRSSPLDYLAGAKVRRMVDHWDQSVFGPFVSESDKLPRNTIEIYTDRFVAIVRPSGTEPKAKFYCHLLPEGAPTGIRGRALLSALHTEAERLAAAIYRDLLQALGISLGDPALALPDIVDLDKKIAFEREIIPRLEERIRAAKSGEIAPTLTWLREACSRLIPGADPLPALKASVGVVCAQLAGPGTGTGTGNEMPLLVSLVEWART